TDRQREAIAEVRSIATACEEYAIDNDFYPWVFAESFLVTIAQHLEPAYMKQLPLRDPWGNPYRYSSSPSGDDYTVRSFGKDGRLGPGPSEGRPEDPDRDIAITRGQFTDEALMK